MNRYGKGRQLNVSGNNSGLRKVHHSNNSGGGNSSGSRVEEEYIRNLQQQIYLLELETRYLKTNNNAAGMESQNILSEPVQNNITAQQQLLSNSSRPHLSQQQLHQQPLSRHSSHDISANSSSAPLNDTIKNLKMKYVELQEAHKKEMKSLEDQLNQMKSEQRLNGLNHQNVERERDELAEAVKSIKEHHATEKDKLYGEAIGMRKKYETAQADLARMELQFQRVNNEKQKLLTSHGSSSGEIMRLKDQVEEQLKINDSLKTRVDELRKHCSELESNLEDANASFASYDMEENKLRMKELVDTIADLKTQIQTMEVRMKQEEHMKRRVMEDCSELVKNNTNLKCELEDVQRRLKKEYDQREQKLKQRQDKIKDAESAKEELGRIRDELSMAKISAESKDRRIHDLSQQCKSLEAALTKAIDTQKVLEERIVDLETRSNNSENELIQLGQDKSLLIDDVAEIRNTAELNIMKVKNLTKERQELLLELSKYQREMAARKEFTHMVQQLEHSGENYLGLMRNVRHFLHTSSDKEEISRDPELLSDSARTAANASPALAL